MRVLFATTIPALGGAEISLAELAAALAARGHAVAAAVPDGPLANRLAGCGCPVFPMPPLRLHRPSLRPGTLAEAAGLLRAAAALRDASVRFDPDVVHANGLAAGLAATLGRRLPCPLVWHCRDLRLDRRALRRMARTSTAILAISPAVGLAVKRIAPPAAGRLTVVENGIDLTPFASATDRHALRSLLGLPPDGLIVGMVSHLVPWKRHDLFIRMAATLRNGGVPAAFAIAGADLFGEHAPFNRALHDQVAAEDLTGQFHWLGGNHPAATIMPAFDLLVHPADNEPFGRVLVESMAAGTPVVATACGGPADIVQHGVTGWLVPPGDAAALAAGARRLLKDEDLRTALTRQGLVHVAAHYDIRRVAADVEAVYARLERR